MIGVDISISSRTSRRESFLANSYTHETYHHQQRLLLLLPDYTNPITNWSCHTCPMINSPCPSVNVPIGSLKCILGTRASIVTYCIRTAMMRYDYYYAASPYVTADGPPVQLPMGKCCFGIVSPCLTLRSVTTSPSLPYEQPSPLF